jgi:hypothetical protein
VPKRPGSRIITADEEARALFKLSQDGTAARRAEILPDLEARVRGIVAEHDMAVKEKFHLERYVSILEGWDPAEAKVDNSPVFLEVSCVVVVVQADMTVQAPTPRLAQLGPHKCGAVCVSGAERALSPGCTCAHYTTAASSEEPGAR